MPEKFVAKAADFRDGERRIVFVGDNEIGVFRHDGHFYAYSNFCLHQGGPACEGLIMHQVEDVIGADKTWIGQKFSDTQFHYRRARVMALSLGGPMAWKDKLVSRLEQKNAA